MQQRAANPDWKNALNGFRGILVAAFLISGVINLLMLTGSFYMLQVYDRVLTSKSVPTLIALSALVAGLYMVQGLLDVIRGQVMVRLGGRLDRNLMPLAGRAVLGLSLQGATTTDAVQPIRDVDAVRSFTASQGLVAILDLPWMPLYLVFVFALHPILGLVAVAGMVVLILLTLLGEYMNGELNRSVIREGLARTALADAGARNAEVLRAMGLGTRYMARFEKANANFVKSHARASDIAGNLTSVSRVFRMILQSAMLGTGAYLAILGEVTAGAIIASSIAGSRAVAPLELAIAQWRNFVAARQSYRRLGQVVSVLPAQAPPMSLPLPKRNLKVQGISVVVPATRQTVLTNISFELEAGSALAVIGQSAAGKSTLARALTGVWPLAAGSIRLDGATPDFWSVEALGSAIGYLPQDVELFDGTIADNISRFEEQPDADAVLAAASKAGIHEMVLRFSHGYDTRIGQGGTVLSAGQRQRIGLARALYRNPFLVILDEPNSNLDADGETALAAAIKSVRERGGIAIIISHRPTVMGSVDLVAVMGAGQLTAFGPKEEVLRKALRPTAVGA